MTASSSCRPTRRSAPASRNTPASTIAVLDINLTPNRPDCTGVNGIARDLAAADIGAFMDRAPKPIKGEFPCPVSVTLDFGQTHPLCPAFALRLVRGVIRGGSRRRGPAPDAGRASGGSLRKPTQPKWRVSSRKRAHARGSAPKHDPRRAYHLAVPARPSAERRGISPADADRALHRGLRIARREGDRRARWRPAFRGRA